MRYIESRVDVGVDELEEDPWVDGGLARLFAVSDTWIRVHSSPFCTCFLSGPFSAQTHAASILTPHLTVSRRQDSYRVQDQSLQII